MAEVATFREAINLSERDQAARVKRRRDKTAAKTFPMLGDACEVSFGLRTLASQGNLSEA